MTRPKFSVCMPVSRDRPWFREALQSVRAQAVDLEIIVSDDSGGALASYVQGLADQRIRYIPNARSLGFAGNHCQTISMALGEHVAFLHDDDVWKPGYLATAGAILDAHPDVGFVLGAADEIDENDRVIGGRPCALQEGRIADPFTHFLAPDFMMLLPSSTVFRGAALADNTRPWPDLIAADLTLYFDLARAGWAVWYTRACPIQYRIHSGQIGTDPLAHRHALASILASYSFENAQHEQLRKERLRQWLIARAGAHLRRGEASEAKSDLRQARVAAHRRVDFRWLGLRMLSEFPRAAPLADRIWAKFYDRFAQRHRGVG